MTMPLAPPPSRLAGVTGRMATIAILVMIAAAGLPLVLSNYQVGLATEVLIFGILAMSIDILAGFAGRTSLGHGAIFGVSTYVVVYVSWPRQSSRQFSPCSPSAPPASTFCC
jgi:branched-chain amino acid transport system permease protein